MPINIPDTLPANSQLRRENIFVMNEERASHQDIRPLKIAILNLMPKKIETETQLLRLLGNSPIQVDIELVQVKSHTSKNTPSEHLFKFYKTQKNGFKQLFFNNFLRSVKNRRNFAFVFFQEVLLERIEVFV